MGMKPRAKPKQHEVCIVWGNLGSGYAVYLNRHRISGSKPWGGGTTVRTWKIDQADIDDALASAVDPE